MLMYAQNQNMRLSGCKDDNINRNLSNPKSNQSRGNGLSAIGNMYKSGRPAG